MPVLDNLTTLIRKARESADAPLSDGGVINLDALHPAPKLALPVKDISSEEDARSVLFEEGLYLARQDAWGKLGNRIRAADSARQMTPGGVPEAELLAEGARADAVTAASRAVRTSIPATALHPIRR